MKDRAAHLVLSFPSQIRDCEDPILYHYNKQQFGHFLKKI